MAFGSGAGANLTTGNDNVDIANAGVVGESGAIRIGTSGQQTAAFLQGVSGTSIPGPTQVVRVNANGQLGTGTAASDGKAAGRNAIDKLRVRNRREDREIGAQSREIATLKREVARLSGH